MDKMRMESLDMTTQNIEKIGILGTKTKPTVFCRLISLITF